ncbi:hypothetical protein [Thauera sp.]|uniref:hypothetical protein n=1 Tax=Thauera sp. TaxID=1905334 RepID=UPI002D143A76|nr:hypothetical protein [Thauera sp.]HRP26043.1 hypothetical protein [Thauera sp.]
MIPALALYVSAGAIVAVIAWQANRHRRPVIRALIAAGSAIGWIGILAAVAIQGEPE